MDLREFIEQEINAERIYCIEDFGECLEKLEFDDGEELDKYEYQNYLDFYIEWADIKINYSHLGGGTVWYEIKLMNEETENN